MVGPLPPYDLAALGLRAYSRRVLDVRVLGGEHALLRPRTLIVCAHRSDLDVPVFAGFLYFAHGNWRRRRLLPHFAVRDDLFVRGFFAGYPRWRSERVRAAAWPVGVGPGLGRLRCRRIRSATRLRLVELFRAAPEVPLAELVPRETAAAFAQRGIDPAAPAREALRGRLADLLWEEHGAGTLEGPRVVPVWTERRRVAHADFRALVDVIASGGTLVIFPEGRPSPDGEIGPLRPGVGALVRRARPDLLLPVSLAYDPLVHGRQRVHLAFGEPAPPPAADVEQEVLALLRRTTPLTAGQIVARCLDADEEVAAALTAGRPVERALVDPSSRARRVVEAAAVAAEDNVLRRLAREHASATA